AEGAQVACLAENTGGRYLQAADAAELTAALSAVVIDAPLPTPPETLPTATLDAPPGAVIGSHVAVTWTGPEAELDAIAVVRPVEGSEKGDVLDYAYVASGNPVTLTMPPEPGVYALHYRYRDQSVIAMRSIEAQPAQVTLDAPDEAPAGSRVTVVWAGPDAAQDNIQIAEVGSGGYIAYTYLGDTNEVELTLPDTPGAYEFRYKFRDREVIATRAITVTAPMP